MIKQKKMMPKYVYNRALEGLGLVLISICCGSATASAQSSADQMVKQAARALGGEKALKRITAWQAIGVITRLRDGAAGRYTATAMKPSLYAVSFDLAGLEIGAGFTGKSSWRRDSREGLRTLTGETSDDFQAEAFYRNNRWFDYKKHRARLVDAGVDRVNGKAARIVTITNARGAQIKLYFDTASALPVKEEALNGERIKTYEYADYRKIDGVLEPFSITLTEGGERYEIKLERITHNPQTGPMNFAFPRLSNEQLPDIQTLLAKAREHQQQLDLLREKYTYTETDTDFQLDKQGVMKEKESETHELTFLGGVRVRRLTGKNNKPLSAEEQAKEDRRIERLIRELEQGKRPDVPYNQRRFKIADLMRVSRFLNPRRERFRKRDVIVFDFEPNPDFKPSRTDDNFIHNLAGSIWIDEADLQVARIEFQLINAFKIGGGALFAMKPGSRFVTEQDRFFGEIWLPVYTEVTINARAMLFASFGIIHKTSYGNYRQFDVQSEEKLKSPDKAVKP